MIYRPGLVGTCVLIAAGAVSFAAEEEDRITRELAADATEDVDVLGLERPAGELRASILELSPL